MYLQVNFEQLVIFTKKKQTIFSDDGNHECLKAVVPFFYFIVSVGGAVVGRFPHESVRLSSPSCSNSRPQPVMRLFFSLPGEIR